MFANLATALSILLDLAATHHSPRCYDLALVGHIIDTADFVALDQSFAPDADIFLGATAQLLVRREAVLAGSAPRLMWLKATMTSLAKPTTRLLLLAKRRTNGSPEVVYFEFLGDRTVRRQWQRKLYAAPLRRCG